VKWKCIVLVDAATDAVPDARISGQARDADLPAVRASRGKAGVLPTLFAPLNITGSGGSNKVSPKRAKLVRFKML